MSIERVEGYLRVRNARKQTRADTLKGQVVKEKILKHVIPDEASDDFSHSLKDHKMKNLSSTRKTLSIALLLSFLLQLIIVPSAFAWSINSMYFTWDAAFSGGSILFHYNLNANVHWLASGRMAPNQANFGTWLYTYVQNGWEARYPVVGALMGENYRICVGAADGNPGAVDFYDHPNNRCFRVWRSSSTAVAAVEIFNVYGHIADNNGVAMSGVTVSDNVGHVTTTDGNGNYVFMNLDAGTYTLTPSKTGYTFSPASRQASGGPPYRVTGQDFAGTAIVNTYSISGRVADGSNISISGVSISDGAGHAATTDASGNYAVSGLTANTYTLTPSKAGYTFSPATLPVTVPPNQTGQNFTAIPIPTYSISGRVADANNQSVPGVGVLVSNGANTTTDGNGNYTVSGLVAGNYTLTPSKIGYVFNPLNRAVVLSANTPNQDFVASLTPSLTISPSSVQDNGSTATVTLSGVQPGQHIRLQSSRKTIDTFGAAEGYVNGNAQYVTTIRSATTGLATVSVINLSQGGSVLPLSAQINFFHVNPPPPPPVKPRITKVSSDFSSDGVSGQFPVGIGNISNKVSVIVDWQHKTPGYVEYRFSGGYVDRNYLGGATSTRTFDFGSVLRAGCNTLTIAAVAADGTHSDSKTYTLGGWSAGLLQPILASLPLADAKTKSVDITIHVPADPIYSNSKAPWLPGKSTSIGPQAVGIIKLPMGPGEYEAGLGIGFERSKSTPGRKPWYARGKFAFLGKNDFEVDLTGRAVGRIGYCPTQVFPPQEIKVSARGKVTFEIKESALIVINPIAPAGPVIVRAVKAVPGLDDWLTARAKLYLDLSLEIGGDAKFKWRQSPYLDSLGLYFQPQIEGGVKIDLYIAEGKVYVLGGSRVDFQISPNPSIKRWTMYGKAGYEVKFAWWKISGERGIEWVLVGQRYGNIVLNSQDVEKAFDEQPWRLVPRPEQFQPSIFVGDNPPIQAFAANEVSTGLPNSSTITTPLLTNVYAYAEPVLAVRNDNHALLTWTNDDPQRPLGQGFDLNYSIWDGTQWSTPSPVMSDTYPDTAPQVTWLSNGNALAVWERLNDPALLVTATLDTTVTQKINLAWSVYDSTSSTWTAPQWLVTNPGENSRTPVLSKDSTGNLWATWRTNLHGEAWGSVDAPEAIRIAQWTGSAWSAPMTVATGIPGLVDLAMIHEGSQGIVAWTVPVTSSVGATPTLQIFLSRYQGFSWSTPERVTDDALNHTRLQLAYLHNQPYLVWLAGDQLRVGSLAAGNVNLSSGAAKAIDNLQINQFKVLKDATGNLFAVAMGQQNQQNDVYLAYYNDALSVWGKPQRLTNDRSDENYPAAALDSTGQLVMAYSRTPITLEQRIDVDQVTGESITYTVPVAGQSDLYTLRHKLELNLTFDHLEISEADPALPNTFTLTATISNTGDIPVTNPVIVFSDNGTRFQTVTPNIVLAAGDVQTVTVTYTVSAEGGVRTLTAMVDLDNLLSETNEADNLASLTAFGADLVLDGLEAEYWGGDSVGIVAHLSNVGNTAAPTTTLAIYAESITGTVLLTQTVPALAAGTSNTLIASWNFGNLALGDYRLIGAVNNSAPQFTEVITDNNFAEFNLPVQTNVMLDPDNLWTTPLMDSLVTFTGTLYNVGHITATNVLVGVYRRPTIDGSSLLFTTTVDLLPPASGATINGQVPGPLGCGLYMLADPYHALTETTLIDNLISVSAENGRCADFWNSPSAGIAPLTAVFTDTSSGQNIGWLWNFGDGFTSTLQSPTHEFTTPGTYTVTLTVNGNDGSDTIQRAETIQVSQPSQAAFEMSIVRDYAPLEVNFTNHSTGDYTTIAWDFGDGGASVDENPTYTFEQPGTYTVTLKVDGPGGLSTTVQQIEVLSGQKVYLPLMFRQ